MRVGLVMAGCASPEPVPAPLLAEAAHAVGADADVALSARSGGRGAGPGVAEALLQLRRAGVDRAVVATTHLVAGAVHERCVHDAGRAVRLFPELLLAPPLLAGEKDVRAVASALFAALPARAGRALVLAGHAGEAASLAYLALEHALWAAGRTDVLVGEPEGLARAALPGDAREVLLAPLSMGLGVHARRDVLGGLRAALEARGVGVEARALCLLDLPAVRVLLLDHVREARPVPGAGDARAAAGAPAAPAADPPAPPAAPAPPAH
ncbi:sirohydrochlorin cobaltochelatase, partial [Olsenella profusa]